MMPAFGFDQHGDLAVAIRFFRQRVMLPIWFAMALGACSSAPTITTTQAVSESADTPYKNILVVTLFSSFDSRRNLEREIVSQLSQLGTTAAPSTSLMNTRTPIVRETFLDMVRDLDADAVLVTQLVSLRSKGSVVDMSPQATVNLRPTGYWNVFSVETTEYVEPQAVDFKHHLVLKSELYSVAMQETVWGIESKSKFELGFDQAKDYSVIVREATAIARQLSRNDLIAN